MSELEASQFSPLPQTRAAVFCVFPRAQSRGFRGMSGTEEVPGCTRSSRAPRPLCCSPVWESHFSWLRDERRCLSLPRTFPQLCVLLCSFRHSWMRGRALCWSPLAPSTDGPEPGSQFPVFFRSSLPVGVLGEGIKCSVGLKPEKKQEKYVCIFFLELTRTCWVLLCFKLAFLLNSDLSLHGKSPAMRPAQI